MYLMLLVMELLMLCISLAVGLELLVFFFSVVMYSPLVLLHVVMHLLSYLCYRRWSASYSLYYEIDVVDGCTNLNAGTDAVLSNSSGSISPLFLY